MADSVWLAPFSPLYIPLLSNRVVRTQRPFRECLSPTSIPRNSTHADTLAQYRKVLAENVYLPPPP